MLFLPLCTSESLTCVTFLLAKELLFASLKGSAVGNELPLLLFDCKSLYFSFPFEG